MSGFRGWFAERPLALDAGLLALVLLVAATLRLTLLGDIPYGLHPDEAQVGTDAARILDGDPLGPYTEAALGQPSGHAYLATPFVAALGHEIIAVRLPLTIVAISTVALLYLFARIALGRPEAAFASLLLATSYWHVFYSRVAHWSISYGAIALAIAICAVLALQRRSRGWAIAGGACAGVGVYTYNIYPVAVLALAAALAVITRVAVPRQDRGWWIRSWGLAAIIAVILALPMLTVVAMPGSEFWDHMANYSEAGLLRSDEFRDASLAGKIELAAAQAKRFGASYVYDADIDIVDASGLRPVFDPLTLALVALGLPLAWQRRRNPAVIIAVCCIIIIPLPAVLQRGSVIRQPVGAAPFVMLVAALPLARAWRAGGGGSRDESDSAHAERASTNGGRAAWMKIALRAGALAVVTAIAVITARDYFWTWRESEHTRFVYHAEVTSAALYMRDLPAGTFVYFYSDRHPLRLETIAFLAPAVEGLDRSERWARGDPGSIGNIRRDVPVSFVLLEPYLELGLLGRIIERYPNGHTIVGERGGRLEFAAYELPPDPGATPPLTPP